jgi:hypothetical protein
MTWTWGKWYGPYKKVNHLGTLSCKDQRQMGFSPIEFTEKAHLAPTTWKAIPNS